MIKLDKLDLKLLQAMHRNCRAKNINLADECGVVPSTTLERIRRLEEQGILKGYQANIDLKSIGLTVQGFVTVSLSLHNVENIRHLEEEIQTVPCVQACYRLSGRFDFILHVVARDIEHFGELIQNRIARIKGISKLETFFIFSEVKGPQIWDSLNCLCLKDEDSQL